jgi:hypothetical protein
MTKEELEFRKTVPIKLGANFMPDGFPMKDIRTIPFRSLLKLGLLPPLESFYSVDQKLGINDNFMFGNDQYGDCVKAMMAHGTLRFEKFETGSQPTITADEVIKEYLRETGGPDIGLNMLLALKDWRNHGLTFGGKLYNIHAFSSVDQQDLTQVRYCIQLLRGIFFAMRIYTTDIDQFRNGEIWHLTGKDGLYEGGHGVYGYLFNIGGPTQRIQLFPGYRRLNLLPSTLGSWDAPEDATEVNYNPTDIFELMTWGVRQQMNTDFWKARILEAYGVIDNRDKWLGNDSPLDIDLMDSWLEQITGKSPDTSGGCPISRFISQEIKRRRPCEALKLR